VWGEPALVNLTVTLLRLARLTLWEGVAVQCELHAPGAVSDYALLTALRKLEQLRSCILEKQCNTDVGSRTHREAMAQATWLACTTLLV
jgi:hypothetical protein